MLYIHAVQQAMLPHLAWVLKDVLNQQPKISWQAQEHMQGFVCARLTWQAKAGTVALLASALRQIPNIWFEISEEGSRQDLPGWFMYTPRLGIFYSATDHAGNFLINEDRVRAAYEKSLGDPDILLKQFSLALGEAWNDELEPLRSAQGGQHKVIPIQASSRA